MAVRVESSHENGICSTDWTEAGGSVSGVVRVLDGPINTGDTKQVSVSIGGVVWGLYGTGNNTSVDPSGAGVSDGFGITWVLEGLS